VLRKALFLLGVQWHPEHMAGAGHRRRMFGAFMKAALAFQRKRDREQRS
jgi:gamma-glutamyl-gamma-aminobutyrate hydrolase PuuD